MNPETWYKVQIEGKVGLVVMLRLTETRKSFVSKNNPDRTTGITRTWRPWPAPRYRPIFTDADFQSTVLERPIGGQPGSLRTVHQQCTGADSVQSCICG